MLSPGPVKEVVDILLDRHHGIPVELAGKDVEQLIPRRNQRVDVDPELAFVRARPIGWNRLQSHVFIPRSRK